MNPIFIVLPILTLLMFDLGLTLKPQDFVFVAKRPKAALPKMVPWPRNLIPACREWKDSSLPENLVSYRNILSVIVISLQKYK